MRADRLYGSGQDARAFEDTRRPGGLDIKENSRTTIDDLKGRKQLVYLSGIERGRILDMGMGDCGCMSFFLAQQGFEVIGIDSSSTAVHKSRKEAASGIRWPPIESV